jgi:outer membrane lipoprotein SlyB
MTQTLLPRLVPALVLAAAALVAGCAQTPLDSTTTTVDNFSKIKAAGIRPVAVGDFQSVNDKRPTEARFLKDTLTTELQGAGMFDANAGASIQGTLVDADMGKTSGSVAARFIVTVAGGRVVYDRELRTSSTWGANANVTREQGNVYSKLVGLLFTDPGFRNAVPR